VRTFASQNLVVGNVGFGGLGVQSSGFHVSCVMFISRCGFHQPQIQLSTPSPPNSTFDGVLRVKASGLTSDDML
jgi:hypothetical protein